MMLKYKVVTFSIAMTLLTPISLAHAQAAVGLTGDVRVIKTVESASGSEEVLVEPTNVVPGDRLVFTTRYSNDSGSKVDNFVISNPLPKAVVLQSDGEFSVSVDGGQTFGALSTLTVPTADGTTRPAQLSDVTDLRWTIATIAPGASGQVKYFAAVR